jgi:RNA polymerase sigma-70 factor (ECF subfamily)
MTNLQFESIISHTKVAVLAAVRDYLSKALPHYIDDVVQETYIQAYKKLQKPPLSEKLLRNAPDVRFIEGRGLPRSRSVSEDGVVEPFENRADGIFRNSFSDIGHLHNYLYTIAKHEALRVNKKEAKQVRLAEKYQEITPHESNLGPHSHSITSLIPEIKKLSIANQQLVSLSADGLALKEISEKLNIKLGTVKSKLHRAKAQLKLYLEGAPK